MLGVGERAPAEVIELADGSKVDPSAWGRPLVLFLYPKSFSGVCTAEMCHVRDDFSEFATYNALVLAISRDTASIQSQFRSKHQLPFEVVADEDGRITKAYKVQMLGGLIPAAQRVTYVIDEGGTIRLAYRKLSGTHSHPQAALKSLKALSSSP